MSFEQFFSECVIPDMSNWSGLSVPDQVLRNLSELGFHSPTLVQRRILPVAAHGKSDIIAAAETVGHFSSIALTVLLLKRVIWNPVDRHFGNALLGCLASFCGNDMTSLDMIN